MRTLCRELLWLAVALAVSWWIVFAPVPLAPAPQLSPSALPPVSLTPVVASYAPAESIPEPPANEPPTEPSAAIAVEPEPQQQDAPPPAELGTPEGQEEAPRRLAEVDERDDEVRRPEPAEAQAEPSAPVAPQREASPAEALMRDGALLAQARDELAGRTARGFGTVLVAAPEDQLAIARFFGESLVLVPRASLDPEAADPRYWEIAGDGPPRVVAVSGRPPLERFRQYRDLFDYEYARLPEPLRDLRRRVLARDDVYLYAALIPPREWALVIGRRSEALAAAERESAEVRTFVLRYARRPPGGFDLDVEEIVLADGTRLRPDSP